MTFTTADLPSVPGDYWRGYANTTSVSACNDCAPGGPCRWDVAEPQRGDERIMRMDIVNPADRGFGPVSSLADYPERLTDGSDASKRSEFYGLSTNQDRLFCGAYDDKANPDCPEVAYSPPTPDLLPVIRFGHTGKQSTEWDGCLNGGFAVFLAQVRFEAPAQADAYATVVLPGLGERPTLRVNEEHVRVTTVFPLLMPPVNLTHYFREYYWLVPGIGKALDILSESHSDTPPADFDVAGFLFHAFEAHRPDSPSPEPVANLRASVVSQKRLELFLATKSVGTPGFASKQGKT
jgi:hypothetical protein